MERTYYTLDDIKIDVGFYPDTKGPYSMQNSSFSGFLIACLQKAG